MRRTCKASGTVSVLLMYMSFVLVLLVGADAYAQVVGAIMSGTVTDPSGAVIPNAQVVIKNTATGVTRTAKTDSSGFYNAPNLLPGPYSVTVSASGFSTQVRSGIVLTVGANQVLNVTLRVGKVTNLIQVTSAAPQVQLASSAISAVVNSTTVRQLPLNGRSWTDLVKLQTGVNAVQTQAAFTQGANRGNRGFGSEVSISGARPQQANYRLDGISINDYSNGPPGSVLGGDLGVDAIQEFSVLTSNYSAEYGRTSGGVVNAITKSGTNQFHGDVYEFLRNDSLDTANFFDNFSNAPKPPFRRNQFGASAGGPIRKNNLFIFGDYEGIRQSQGIASVSTVPSLAARSGNLCSSPGSPPACAPTSVTVDPAAQQYLGFFPLPNGSILGNGDTGLFSFEGQQVVSENFFTTRVDQTFSEKDSLFGTYLYDDTPFTFPSGLNNVLQGSHTNRQTAVLEETHIFSPVLVNSIRIGYNRDGVANDTSVKAINPLAADTSLGADPGGTAAQVNVAGLSPFTGGLGGQPSAFFFWNSYQAYDDAFFTSGTHSLKFGVALERMQANYVVKSNFTGLFSFGSLTDFLTNHPARFNTGLPTAPTGLRQTLFGAYVQDDWRWRPNLTLNLGLRYEMTTVPTEAQNKLSVLQTLASAVPHLGNPYFSNPTLTNFEPRVGFAWDPFRNGKTAIRGGFGIFDALPLPYEFLLPASSSAPFTEQGSVAHVPAGSFYKGAFPLLGVSSLAGAYIEQQPQRNYVMQWNFNVQRQLTPSLTATVGYIGSRGVHQPFRTDDADIVLPTLTSQGYVWPSPVGSGTTLNPNFGQIRALMWAENSFYDALQVGVQKRMSHGLQVQGSYTWGKSIDSNSSTIAGDQFSNSISSLPWFNLNLNRGLSDFNIGRTFVINGVWDAPAIKSLSGPAAWMLNGWQLGGIYTASDGVPFNATFGTDGDPLGLNSSDPWDFANRLTGPGCKSLVNPGNPNNYVKTQCFAIPVAPSLAFYNQYCDPSAGVYPQCFNLHGNAGRNILIGPGTSDLDFSVVKNNPIRRISENFNVQFRVEFFNILNRPNFAVPITPDNTDIFNSAGIPTGATGLLTSTTTSSREIQFALKVVW
ncbi:MAG TPA: TonB-dependent receptor [Terriglobia bacterium]|nr:TonB-dependent receptor [Terriglobia bacterium]